MDKDFVKHDKFAIDVEFSHGAIKHLIFIHLLPPFSTYFCLYYQHQQTTLLEASRGLPPLRPRLPRRDCNEQKQLAAKNKEIHRELCAANRASRSTLRRPYLRHARRPPLDRADNDGNKSINS
ncbi:hypothetical protein MRB53_027927 [Persea americana]|uniref:Uncharacterized protein n=1 Tax=Persea americana TaxID=3435 RepID=A0ACC2KE97_PERAE|nr:hypothetical protein MRB53_027927 [Persea americana]